MNQCHPLPLHELLKGQRLFLNESVTRGGKNTGEGNECVTQSPRKSGTPKLSARNCVFGPLGNVKLYAWHHHHLVVRSLFSPAPDLLSSIMEKLWVTTADPKITENASQTDYPGISRYIRTYPRFVWGSSNGFGASWSPDHPRPRSEASEGRNLR